MGWFQRLFNSGVKYEDESSKRDNEVTVKDLLKFAEQQSKQSSQIVAAVLAQAASQARVMENYIELFKPRQVASTTLEQREAMKSSQSQIRKSEWEKIETPGMFNQLAGIATSDGIPPEPEEF